jgi:hypothetical protein
MVASIIVFRAISAIIEFTVSIIVVHCDTSPQRFLLRFSRTKLDLFPSILAPTTMTNQLISIAEFFPIP